MRHRTKIRFKRSILTQMVAAASHLVSFGAHLAMSPVATARRTGTRLQASIGSRRTSLYETESTNGGTWTVRFRERAGDSQVSVASFHFNVGAGG